MNRRMAAVFICTFSALVSSPRLAHAQRSGGGWDWLDRLSGPGRFNGGFAFTSLCLGGETTAIRYTQCSLNGEKIWLNLGVSYVRAGEEPARDFPSVAIFALEQSVDLRVARLESVPFDFEWGFGWGIHQFRGDEFDDFWRMSFDPIRLGIVWRAANALHVQGRFTTTYFVDGFTAADFGSTSDFEARGELVPAIVVSFAVNVSSLLN